MNVTSKNVEEVGTQASLVSGVPGLDSGRHFLSFIGLVGKGTC